MGNMLVNVLAFAVMQGLNGALETLISQSFGASQDPTKLEKFRLQMRKNCGLFYNRGRFVVSVVMVPIILIFAFSDKILVAIGQDPGVSSIARRYVTLMIPGVWAMGQFDASKKFLSAQYKNNIPVWTQLVTTLLHLGWCQLFIRKMDLRERGAAAATNITYILNLLIVDAWIRIRKNHDFKDMVYWYDRTCYTNLWPYLKIGVPGMLMLCFEWWAFELLAIFTGLLSVNDLAAEVVIINLTSFIFMLPLGISYSASALTGNYLGENKIDLAKKFAQMTVVFDIILTSIVVLILGTCQDQVSSLFTKEPEVTRIFKQTMWVLLIYIWFDTIHGVQSGIIRGLGRQSYGSIFTLFCYYILGMPLALVLCFVAKMGIQGLWLGFSIACIILDIGFAMIISCPNWTEIAAKMRQQIEAGQCFTPEVSSYRARLYSHQKEESIASRRNSKNMVMHSPAGYNPFNKLQRVGGSSKASRQRQ